jgi:DNA segregation ATPase FtsK/SpoIIIE-like protein
MTDRDAVYAHSDVSDAEMEAARRHVRVKPSTSYLQRMMQIPYSHATRLMECLEAERFVTPRRANGSRDLGPAANQ